MHNLLIKTFQLKEEMQRYKDPNEAIRQTSKSNMKDLQVQIKAIKDFEKHQRMLHKATVAAWQNSKSTFSLRLSLSFPFLHTIIILIFAFAADKYNIKNDGEAPLCISCLENPIDILPLCGHASSCSSCLVHEKNSNRHQCPICREQISDFIIPNVYGFALIHFSSCNILYRLMKMLAGLSAVTVRIHKKNNITCSTSVAILFVGSA